MFADLFVLRFLRFLKDKQWPQIPVVQSDVGKCVLVPVRCSCVDLVPGTGNGKAGAT
jgi:hypothetical protein